MTVFSLVETAKANGLGPQKYLQYLLDKRPSAEMTYEELEQLVLAMVNRSRSNM